jgi:hypothetical protein
MLRTFFAGLGVVFAALILFGAGFFGRLALELSAQGPANSPSTSRETCPSGGPADIKQHFAAPMASKLGGGARRRPLAR